MDAKPRYEEMKSRLERLDKELQSYKIIFNEIEDGYIELDLKGRIELFNPALCRILGYLPGEMKGLRYQKYMSAATADNVFQKFNAVYETGIPNKAFDYEIIRKDNAKLFVEISITLRKNSLLVPDGFRVILRDVTQRSRAERELAKHKGRLEAIFRSVKEAIITVDSDMNVIDANKAAETICGFSFLDLNRNSFSDCRWECCQACHDVLAETLLKKEADRKSTRLNSSHNSESRMPSSA
jgi:PAS domain S-box-containing protein